jgi:maltooligosyltrehalose synthase
MPQYDKATQARIETQFQRMLHTDREESAQFFRLYQVVTWGLFPRRPHVERKRATADFFRRLADYAERIAREAEGEGL